MKPLRVVFLLLAIAMAQAAPTMTTIADTIVNADGSRFTGEIVITWQPFTALDGSSVPGGSKVVTVVGGLLRMQLVPYNAYTADFQTSNGLSFRQYWSTPASATPLRLSDLYSPPVVLSSGVYQQAITTGMSSLSVTAAQHGCGPNPTWRVWDNSTGWTEVDAILDTSGNLSLSWTGSFVGYARLSCGLYVPNYSATFATSDATLLMADSSTGFLTGNIQAQCYDASGNYFTADASISGSFDVTLTVNPTGDTPIAGRCVAGAF